MENEGWKDVSFMLHCAVYALLKNKEVVYIGQSKKPLTRVYSHMNARGKFEPWRAGYKERKKGFQFDAIWIRPCMLSELDELEARMIKTYQPKHNVKHKTTVPIDLAMLVEMMPMVPMLPPNPEPRQWPSWRRV